MPCVARARVLQQCEFGSEENKCHLFMINLL